MILACKTGKFLTDDFRIGVITQFFVCVLPWWPWFGPDEAAMFVADWFEEATAA